MNNNTKMIVAIFAGTAVGIIAGILLAPEKGSLTRKKLKKALTNLTDEVNDMIVKSQDIITEKVNEFRDNIHQAGEDIQKVAEHSGKIIS